MADMLLPAELKMFDAHLHLIDPRFPLIANQGYLPLPFTCADYLTRMRHYPLRGGAVVSGSFQGLDQSYLVEALKTLGEGFIGVTQLPVSVSDEQLRLVPVPVDAQGVNPTVLEEILQRSKAKLFYCQPTYLNPTGAVLPTERRGALLDVIRRAGAFLIEDDWAHDLAFEKAPPPLATLDGHGHVIYVRSLTKSASPSLRVGVLCARGAAFERLCGARIIEDLYVSSLLQETALQLVTSPAWSRHLRQLRENLKERRDALVSAVVKHFGPGSIPLTPTGGLHLWVKLPAGIADVDLVAEAAAAHIAIMPGRDSFPAEHTGEYVRLTFAGARPAVLESAVTKLGRCLARFL